jgi:hypothetical protein
MNSLIEEKVFVWHEEGFGYWLFVYWFIGLLVYCVRRSVAKADWFIVSDLAFAGRWW